jgi:4-hydroxy-tetrahydrodipicolinate synthase
MGMKKFFGAGTAIVTPFNDDKTVDYESLEKFVDFQISEGINYLVVLGTTGETPTVTKEEKRLILDTVIKKTKNRVPIVAGIGGNSTADIIHTFNSFDFENVDGILSVCPYYNKPSQQGIYEHFKALAKLTTIPIILYNVPGRTSVNMKADTTLRLAHEFDNIVAIKEASGKLDQVTTILKNRPDDFSVLSGDDSFTFPLLSLGGDGVISVISNVIPSMFSKMVRYAINGELLKARDIHIKLADLMKALFLDGNPAGVKAALSMKGYIDNNLRLPLIPVKEEVYKKIEEELSKI